MKNICVFCGSKPGAHPAYTEAAQEMGTLLAEKEITLVYGGGKVGLMGVVADAVLEQGGKVIGVIPEFLALKEVAHQELTELITVQTMHQRKEKMADLSDAFIALPGGMGTLEELCEIITWAQLGLHTKPFGLMNTEEYYTPLINFFDQMVSEQFLAIKNRAMVLCENEAKTCLSKAATIQVLTLRDNKWPLPTSTGPSNWRVP